MFFPNIKFVDEIPKEILSTFNLSSGQRLTGTINYRTKQIYVLRAKKDKLVLLHELGHWLIYVVFGLRRKEIHIWFDKHFSVKQDISLLPTMKE